MEDYRLTDPKWIAGFISCCIVGALAMTYQVGGSPAVKIIAGAVSGLCIACIIALTIRNVVVGEANQKDDNVRFILGFSGTALVFSLVFIGIAFLTG